MATYYSVLGQKRPASTSPVDLYRTPPTASAVLSTIAITNTTDVTAQTSVYLGTGGSAASDAVTWSPRTLGYTINLWCVTNSGSLWVVGGTSGLLGTSTDGLVWTTRNASFSATQISAVAYGNGVYVAAGIQGKLSTSTDGITWTIRTSGISTSYNITALTYGNGLFVAASSLGMLSTSTDGVTWTTRDSALGSAAANGLTYGDGTFMVVGGVNGFFWSVSTSTDGLTWTSRAALSSSTAALAVTYGNGLFIAGGNSGLLCASTDGITWTTRDAKFETSNILAMAYGNGIYVASGASGKLRTSTDAITWTTRDSTISNNFSVQGLSYNSTSGMFVLAGQSGYLFTSYGSGYTSESKGTALLYKTPVPAKSTISLTLGVALSGEDKVSVQSNIGSALTFHAFGSEII